MKRRDLIATGAAALSLALLPTSAPAADLTPIAIAEVGQGRARSVIRIYPGEERNSFLMHVRGQGRTFTQRLRLSGDGEGLMRSLAEEGEARFSGGRLDGTLYWDRSRPNQVRIDGVGDVNS